MQALKNKQIDGLVVDLPTAFYVTAVQVPNSKILGQFPTRGRRRALRDGVREGQPARRLRERALAKLKANGTLEQIQQQWLAKATGAPVLK